MTVEVGVDVVLLDLDGVIRHFDEEIAVHVEAAHGLERGTLARVAFESELLHELCVGRISRAEWISCVGDRVGSRAAAAERFADIGTVDPAMLTLVDRIRSGGLPVAILTNGTDTIPAELDLLGIATRVDQVFNTATIGVCKPDPAVFRHVCDALDVAPSRVFFADDSAKNVAAADAMGLLAHHFVGIGPLVTDLRERARLSV